MKAGELAVSQKDGWVLSINGTRHARSPLVGVNGDCRQAILKQAAFPTELTETSRQIQDSSSTQAQIPDYLLACFSSSDKYCFTMATSSGLLAYFRYSRSCVASFAGSPFAS